MCSTLTFDSVFSNNAVFILDGLKLSDLQTAKNLHDELRDLAGTTTGMPFISMYKVNSRKELFAALKEIQQYCSAGSKPIIHFEVHGDKEGIFIGDTEEKISWGELITVLRQINTVTKNNLGVVMASCYGLYAITIEIEITEPSPFYFLIGSEEEILSGLIADQMKEFYRQLLLNDSICSAMAQVDEKFKQFHVEKFFCMVMGRYFKRACMGKGAAERVERLVSEAFEQGTSRNRENLQKLRRSYKSAIKPSKATFDKYANIFMHGRYAITYKQFYAVVVG